MPLLEINRDETAPVLTKRPSLGKKLKEKILRRLSSISSTMRVHTHTHPINASIDENILTDPHSSPPADILSSAAATAASHPLSSQHSHDGGDTLLDRLRELHSLPQDEYSEWPQWQPSHSTDELHSQVSVRRSVTVDEECFAQQLLVRTGRSLDMDSVKVRFFGGGVGDEHKRGHLMRPTFLSTQSPTVEHSYSLLRSVSAPAHDLPATTPAALFSKVRVVCDYTAVVICRHRPGCPPPTKTQVKKWMPTLKY